MANIINFSVQHQGTTDVWWASVDSDGSEETSLIVYNPADYHSAGYTGTKTCILRSVFSVASSTAIVKLYWDADVDVLALCYPAYLSQTLDFTCIGGIKPPAVAGLTGILKASTAGLAAGDALSFVTHVRNYK